jgi:anti-anti-sigma regulatory factor
MRITSQPAVSNHAAVTALFTVDLDAVDSVQLGRALAQQAQQTRPQLLVDCSTLKCLRTLGVSHVVSQLLVLHQSGANVWLRNVDASLLRCLRLLQLDSLFLIS